MARIRFREIAFKDDTLAIIVQANRFIAEYGGHSLTVRQLFYRFVATNTFPDSWRDIEHGGTKNTDKNYKRLGAILGDARYAGLIDWDHIEDRNREAQQVRDWSSGRAALDELANAFRFNRWGTQPFYVELWSEKAALAGVLGSIAVEYHVPLMVTRGYSSASAMKDSADRISERCHGRQVRPVILYVGDHDPSGEDMVRDCRERLAEFRAPEWLDVRKVAITMEQVEQYKPPPNPLKTKRGKLSDSRAKRYLAEHGHSSWEADALPPDELRKLVTDTLKAYVDKEAMDKVIGEENEIRAKLKAVAKKIDRVKVAR